LPSVGFPDERLGERACAFVTLHPGRSLDLNGVRRHLEGCQPDASVLARAARGGRRTSAHGQWQGPEFKLREMAKGFALVDTRKEAP
jgi:cyclohexanecarboxylate-CoA ligase